MARVHGAVLHTIVSEGSRASVAVHPHRRHAHKVERLEAEYNDGQPFPPVGARAGPSGRPMEEVKRTVRPVPGGVRVTTYVP